ncbi:MAG: glutaminase A [Niameybacter sp.]|uniref:glutaminase A n=1 Tax=Niameybacter sp. TaxID=2033640 RepID=UPI002FC81923
MEKILQQALEYGKQYTPIGKVASYIPELHKSSQSDLGIYIKTLDGKGYGVGAYDKKFTIQSISKVIVLTLALMDKGCEKVFKKVGVEATGDPFNSIVRLELKHLQKPLNPMINAGAIATTSLIHGKNGTEQILRILEFAKLLSDNPEVDINQEVYESEIKTGDRNRSLAYFMKSSGVIEGDVESLIEVYFKQCSIEMTCQDLARIGAIYSNNGLCPKTHRQLIPKTICRMVMAIMTTCGLYDASGEFAVRVGIPAKSGVGGGILAAVPNKLGIGVYGPALDEKGNSVGGVEMLAYLADRLDLSIF